MNLGALVDRAVKKRWSDADVEKYVGRHRYAALTHAASAAVRQYAASGGTTTALLMHGLETGQFDGAVVCTTAIEDGRVRGRFSIATTADEVLAAQGSKYVEVTFVKEVVPLLQAFDGRVAVVGLPCDITALTRRAARDAEIRAKIALTVALVCGHNSRKELIDHVTDRMERRSGKGLAGYRFRIGHWRGQIEATFDDGSVERYPTRRFNDYQNLYFFCERKCLACHDHYGYDADVSVGDVWLYSLRRDPIKHTGVIVRSEAGDRLVSDAVARGAVVSKDLDIRDIMDGQSRIGPAHYNVSARARVAPRFGINLKDSVHERVRWFQYLNAWISLANMRLSETVRGRRIIFRTPPRMIRAYVYLKKALETLR